MLKNETANIRSASAEAERNLGRRSRAGEKYGRTLAFVASAIGFLAVPNAIASAHRSNPAAKQASKEAQALRYYGFDDNRLLSTRQPYADAAAQQDRLAGATGVTVYTTITEGNEAASIDLTRLCVADRAATKHGLKFNINIAFRDQNGDLGYMPTTNPQIAAATSAEAYMMDHLAACEPNDTNSVYITGNEWNNSTFNSNAPNGEGPLLTYSYPILKAEAARLKRSLKIVAGSVSTSLNNNPVLAIDTLKNELGPIKAFDALAVNQYSQGVDGTAGGSTEDRIQTDNALAQTINEIHADFGEYTEIIVGELGSINTDTPAPIGQNYNQPVAASLALTTSENQGQFYQESLTSSLPCEGVSEAYIYQYEDDGTGLRTGITYYNGAVNYKYVKPPAKKDSYKLVKDGFSKISASDVVKCAPENAGSQDNSYNQPPEEDGTKGQGVKDKPGKVKLMGQDTWWR